MFSGYNENFPYSYITSKLVRAFPTWTKIRKDPNSIGAQFLNVFGLEVQEVDGFLAAALNNQYIGLANIGEVAWIYKTMFKTEDADSVTVVKGFDFSVTPVEHDMTECSTLFEFYSSDIEIHPFIIDFGTKTLYSKQKYSTIQFGNEKLTDIVPHQVWNIFDEFALLLGLRRRLLESNAELKERIMDVFRFPGNSTKIGLQRAIGRELGLVFKKTWPEDVTTFVISETEENISIIPETFIVNGKPLQEDQYYYDNLTKEYSIYAQYRAFFDKQQEYTYTDVVLSPEKYAKLAKGAKQGFILTSIIDPPNLKEWSEIIIDGIGDIKVDIVRYDFDKYADQSKAYIARGIDKTTSLLGSTPIHITEPIRLIVTLSRPLRTDNVELRNIVLKYIPKESTVSCIHDIGMNALHEDSFRNSLFEVDRSPSKKLKDYVSELNTLVPIMWGSWKWDESYWDVVEKNLMGLHVLPNRWDPRLGEISNIYLQTGIGDSKDCFVKFDDSSWFPWIHSGYYYLSENETHIADGTNIIYTKYKRPQFVYVSGTDPDGKKIVPSVISVRGNRIQTSAVPAGSVLTVSFCAEHYLYSSPAVENFAGPVSEIELANYPMQGAPIVVEATNSDGKRVLLSQVAFLDDCSRISITNAEKINGNGTNKIAAKYSDLIDVTVSGCNVVSIDENIISLDRNVGPDEVLDVSYKQLDSFVLTTDNNKAKLVLSDEYTDVEVTVESQDLTAYREYHALTFDPLKTHLTEGFIFISSTIPELNDFDIKVHPDVVCADGSDSCIVVVDCIDRFNNPMLNIIPNYTIEMTRDDNGAAVPATGTLELTDTIYNRIIYRYIAPENEDMPKDEEDNTIPCSAKITFTSGSASEVVEIKVR